eukprot:1674046-Heterocapsa_arctica.AAC.1
MQHLRVSRGLSRLVLQLELAPDLQAIGVVDSQGTALDQLHQQVEEERALLPAVRRGLVEVHREA